MKTISAAALALVLSNALAFAPSTLNNGRNVQTQLFERKPFITGNWKLNPSTKGEAIQLATDIVRKMTPESPEVALFVPFPFIETVQNVVGDKIKVGAEVSNYYVDLVKVGVVEQTSHLDC